METNKWANLKFILYIATVGWNAYLESGKEIRLQYRGSSSHAIDNDLDDSK
jgi:hypothetical protein